MTAATQPATPAAPNNNEPVRVNHTARNVIITIVVVAIIAVAAFFGYRAFAGANESSAKGSKGNPVKIGVVGATNPEWVKFKQDAEKAGIYVDIVDLLYLANYNVSNKKDLQPIGGTAIYPLGVYSTKVKDIKDLKQGDTVTIPNDETNQARAIGVLKAAGLVTLKGDWTAFSTPADIDEAKSKVKVTTLKAEQVATTLKDPTIAAGAINNDYVADAGLDPKDAIYQDDAESEEARPYINVWVARKADVNNETYKKLVSIYQQKDVLDALQENSGGTAVFADKFSASELQGFLSDIEKDAKAQQ